MPLVFPLGFRSTAGQYGPAITLNGTDEYLSRTPGTLSSNRRLMTWSVWVYRNDLAHNDPLMQSYSATTSARLFIEAGGSIVYRETINSPSPNTLSALVFSTSVVPAGEWVHVFALRNGNEAASERMRFWINGVESGKTVTDAAEVEATLFTFPSVPHYIGRDVTSGSFFDGKLAHYHYLDAVAGSVSDFGETQGGVWKAKSPAGLSYGNNGFFLDFANPADLGNDAGSTHDQALTGIDSSNATSDGPPLLEV